MFMMPSTTNVHTSYSKRAVVSPARRTITTRVRAKVLKIKKPILTENLLEDIQLCAEWADEAFVKVLDRQGSPMFLLTPERIHWALSKAAAALAAGSAVDGPCWSIEELIAPDNFARFCDVISDLDAIRVVIQIAKEWVGVTTSILDSMEASAGQVIRF